MAHFQTGARRSGDGLGPRAEGRAQGHRRLRQPPRRPRQGLPQRRAERGLRHLMLQLRTLRLSAFFVPHSYKLRILYVLVNDDCVFSDQE